MGGRSWGPAARGDDDHLPASLPQIKGMEEVMHHSQSYSTTLQAYNTTLQADLNNEKAKREEGNGEPAK